MKRKLLDELIGWSNCNHDCNKKSVFLTGSRAVGKTFLAFDYSKSFYSDSIYMNFERHTKIAHLFYEKDPLIIINNIEAYFKIRIVESTILIFDEIDSCPDAINFLIEISKVNKNLNIIAISSKPLLYIYRQDELIPVILHLTLYPFDFEEYLWATGYEWYVDVIREHYQSNKKVPDIVHKELLELFEQYIIVGGMPSAINEYINTESFINISEQHHIIMEEFFSDAAHHKNESTSIKVRNIINSLDCQISKKNKKFQYKLIRKGASKKQYEESIHYMTRSNMVIKSKKLDSDSFKLYLCDVGMQISKINERVINIETIEKDILQKGLIENYVAENLICNHTSLYFWESNAQAKIDFIIKDASNNLLPIEVSIDKHTRSKSLSIFKTNYQIKNSIKVSSNNFSIVKDVKYVPFYAVFCI